MCLCGPTLWGSSWSLCATSPCFLCRPLSVVDQKKPDVMWAEIWETDCSWGQWDCCKLLSNAFDSCDWVPVSTGREVRLTPLRFTALVMGSSPPHLVCFQETSKKFLSSRFSSLSNATMLASKLKKKIVLGFIDPHTHQHRESWKPTS